MSNKGNLKKKGSLSKVAKRRADLIVVVLEFGFRGARDELAAN